MRSYLDSLSRRINMGFRVNTNVVSLNAQRHLGKSKYLIDKSLQRISSGKRINRAADDAAGIAISEELKADIKGLRQVKRNSQDGISLVQIAEGGLSEISNILIRLRELAIQSSSDTIGNEEREFISLEFEDQKKEINRIVLSTEFNGVRLLDGKEVDLEIQIGTGNDPLIDRLVIDSSAMGISFEILGLDTVSLISKKSSQDSLSILDRAISLVSKSRAYLGASQNRLQSIISNLDISLENISEANSRVRDADIASESAEMTKGNILLKAGISVLAQANQTPANILSLVSSSMNM